MRRSPRSFATGPRRRGGRCAFCVCFTTTHRHHGAQTASVCSVRPCPLKFHKDGIWDDMPIALTQKTYKQQQPLSVIVALTQWGCYVWVVDLDGKQHRVFVGQNEALVMLTTRGHQCRGRSGNGRCVGCGRPARAGGGGSGRCK